MPIVYKMAKVKFIQSMKTKAIKHTFEIKQKELNNLLIQYALTKIKHPKIDVLRAELDYFCYGLKL